VPGFDGPFESMRVTVGPLGNAGESQLCSLKSDKGENRNCSSFMTPTAIIVEKLLHGGIFNT
jgi:hypothetical protein